MVPLVLLHGSGGAAHDLVPLAMSVAPGAPVLGLLGSVEIDGGRAFFQRNPDRTIDEADLLARLPLVVGDIERHGFARPPVAIGFSNGAIMAAAILLTRPGLLAGAILFRPLSPFQADRPERLNGTPVLIAEGAKDSRREPGDGGRLAVRLTRAGAMAAYHVLPVGHSITPLDQDLARDWLRDQV